MTESALLLVTVGAVVLAAAMGTIAWRMAREERRRSDARIAALAAEIRAPEPSPPARRFDLDLRSDAPLAAPVQGGTRSVAAVALGVFVVGAVAALVIFASGSALAPTSAQQAAGAAATAGAARPLELIALGHEREGDQLTVRGVVRNPNAGAAVRRLTAVVLVFDRAGGLATSARAPIPQAILAPGAESTFVVAVPSVADVGRYRLSFRASDRVIPHVDRRGRGETASHP